jgi:hypothetical protein
MLATSASPGTIQIRVIKSVDELVDVTPGALSPNQIKFSDEVVRRIFEEEAKKLNMRTRSLDTTERAGASNNSSGN